MSQASNLTLDQSGGVPGPAVVDLPGLHDAEAESKAEETLMTTLVHEVRTFDEGNIKGIKEDMETLLTFAGLFSAALTAFTVESFKQLKPDSDNATVFLLATIARHLNATVVDQDFFNQFRPTPVTSASRHVNGLWLSSLFLSLVTASLAMLAKQWLREFLALRDTPAKFLHRHYGLTVYRVYEITAFLPLFLQLALIFFLVGLPIFVCATDSLIGWAITCLVTTWLLLYAVSFMLPAFSYTCPYKTPVLPHLRGFLVNRICGPILEVVCWIMARFAGGNGSAAEALANYLHRVTDPSKSKGNYHDPFDLYSIHQLQLQFRHLAVPGLGPEMLRKIVEIMQNLDSPDLILGWVKFLGGIGGVPADLRPALRKCIAKATDSPFPRSDWRNRLDFIFEESGESEADSQALREIMRDLPARFKLQDSLDESYHTNLEATHFLLTHAMGSSYVDSDDICILIQDIGGIDLLPHRTRPLVQDYLIEDVLRVPRNWQGRAEILLQPGVDALCRERILRDLPERLEAMEDVVQLVEIAGSMWGVPAEIRPTIRQCVTSKSSHTLPWQYKAELVLQSVTGYDVGHFGSLFRHVVASLKQYWLLHAHTTHAGRNTIFAERSLFFQLTSEIDTFLADNSAQIDDIVLDSTDSQFLKNFLLPEFDCEAETMLMDLPVLLFLLLHTNPAFVEYAQQLFADHLGHWAGILAAGAASAPPDSTCVQSSLKLVRELEGKHVCLRKEAKALHKVLETLNC